MEVNSGPLSHIRERSQELHPVNCSKLTEENPRGGETSRFLLKDEGVYLACEIHQLSACLQ